MLKPEFEGNLREVTPSTLAYVGDAVYELAVRLHVMGAGKLASGFLHRRSIDYAKASAQARAMRFLQQQGLLDDLEEAVFRRARNYSSKSLPKSADPVDYKLATGLEAVLGYHYLAGDQVALDRILEAIFTYLDQDQIA